MVRMGPDAFKTLVGMASSFEKLATPKGVSPAAAREAQVMAGLSALQKCRFDRDSELSDEDVTRFNLRYRPSLGSSLDDTI